MTTVVVLKPLRGVLKDGCNVRAGASSADRELIQHLDNQGLTVSASQLERWRAAGLLPRRQRRGRGRGGGSAATRDPGEVEIAAALARHSRQGRDLRLVTIDWFVEAGQAEVFGPPVPEPPDNAVRNAIAWALERSESYRLIQMAHRACTDEDIDAYYQRADGLLHSEDAIGVQLAPGVVRQALLDGRDLPDSPASNHGDPRASLLHLTAAVGIGVDEIGTDLIAEAIASLMEIMNIPIDAMEDMTEVLRDPQRSRHVRTALSQAKTKDPLAAVQQADGQQLRRARTVALGLAGCGGLYLFHGLLMPDSTGQAALRSLIDQLGLGTHLMHVASQMNSRINSTSGVASCIASCLDDWNSDIYDLLFDQLKHGPPLISGEDSKENGERFVSEWLDTMKQLASKASESGSLSAQ